MAAQRKSLADSAASYEYRTPVGRPGFISGAGINKDITDGTSHTMIMGEYVTGPPESDCGEHWLEWVGLSQLYVHDTPNSSSPDSLFETTSGDGSYGIDGGVLQGNLPDQNLPCTSALAGFRNKWAASRSRHPGGVNVVLRDSSVQFVSETIALNTWQNFGYFADGKLLDDF